MCRQVEYNYSPLNCPRRIVIVRKNLFEQLLLVYNLRALFVLLAVPITLKSILDREYRLILLRNAGYETKRFKIEKENNEICT